MRPRVAVIGGRISSLSAAHRLAKQAARMAESGFLIVSKAAKLPVNRLLTKFKTKMISLQVTCSYLEASV